jgi:hypothetical protein
MGNVPGGVKLDGSFESVTRLAEEIVSPRNDLEAHQSLAVWSTFLR